MLKNNCLNCGKTGHMLKECKDPTISYGIICFNISPEINIRNKHIENYFYNKYIDIMEYNYSNLDNIPLIPEYYNMIKFLLVRRKHSMNYVQFIRGKYNIDELKEKIGLNPFELMSYDEIVKIQTISFDVLWDDLWKETAKNKIYMKEYKISKHKFEELQNNNFYNLITESTVHYMEPEWGFPKGRRNMYEQNLVCALREFTEETHIDTTTLHVMERLDSIMEEYIGTDSKNYRHIYYMANSENEIDVSCDNVQLNEIGDIGWFTIPEVMEKIRPYNVEKIKMIHMVYFFIINMVVNITKESNISIL